jgi:hypothetical protein
MLTALDLASTSIGARTLDQSRRRGRRRMPQFRNPARAAVVFGSRSSSGERL